MAGPKPGTSFQNGSGAAACMEFVFFGDNQPTDPRPRATGTTQKTQRRSRRASPCETDAKLTRWDDAPTAQAQIWL
jgi:hypothetical protein